MVINGRSLLFQAPIKNMLTEKHTAHGVTHGLTECGYDLQIKQSIMFDPCGDNGEMMVHVSQQVGDVTHVLQCDKGKFALASAIEKFQMPGNLMGVVHDKSTWARRGLSVFNTVIEPKWEGHLTLELVYHGNKQLFIPAGSGIAQVIFHDLTEPAAYKGRYQGQADKPVPAILA